MSCEVDILSVSKVDVMKKYAKAGVDIKRDGEAVKSLLAGMKEKELPGVFAKYHYVARKAIGISTDGVGSKLLCYQKLGNVSNAAYDLVAMNVNDLASEYIPPLLFVDYVSVNKSDQRMTRQLGEGLGRAAKEAQIILAGGELASLPDQIKEQTFDWAGAVVGIEDAERHGDLIQKRESLSSGLIVVGIKSSGIHSNGLTLARTLLRKMDADTKVTQKTLLEELTAPTHIYSPSMIKLREICNFFVPITGGGYTNVNRILPKFLDAELQIDGVPQIFNLIQEKLEVSSEEMYEMFNMGYRMILGTEKAEQVIDEVTKEGKEAKIVGELQSGCGNTIVNGIVYKSY